VLGMKKGPRASSFNPAVAGHRWSGTVVVVVVVVFVVVVVVDVVVDGPVGPV